MELREFIRTYGRSVTQFDSANRVFVRKKKYKNTVIFRRFLTNSYLYCEYCIAETWQRCIFPIIGWRRELADIMPKELSAAWHANLCKVLWTSSQCQQSARESKDMKKPKNTKQKVQKNLWTIALASIELSTSTMQSISSTLGTDRASSSSLLVPTCTYLTLHVGNLARLFLIINKKPYTLKDIVDHGVPTRL